MLRRCASTLPAGAEKAANLSFHNCDVLDKAGLDAVFAAHGKVDSVIHFAGLKAVGESMREPMKYYSNNIAGTITLVEVMEKHGCRSIIFSSSATVYGEPTTVPCTEVRSCHVMFGHFYNIDIPQYGHSHHTTSWMIPWALCRFW